MTAETHKPTPRPVKPPEARGGADAISGANGLGDALRAFRKAARTRRSEPICAAYRDLRKAANGMALSEVFAKADEALGEPTQPLVISAFAHWHCFMCDDGAVECDQCEGTGRNEDEEVCSACDGLGFTTCDFCRGTGWVDAELIPPELQQPVLKHHISTVRTELQRLRKALLRVSEQELRGLGRDERVKLARRLLRLQARMRDLAGSTAIDDEHADLYRRAAHGLDRTLDVLRGD
jgi:hypothetical protein